MLLASSFTSAQVVFMLGSRQGASVSPESAWVSKDTRASLTLNSPIALLKDTQRSGQGISSGEERTEGGRGFLTPGRL